VTKHERFIERRRNTIGQRRDVMLLSAHLKYIECHTGGGEASYKALINM